MTQVSLPPHRGRTCFACGAVGAATGGCRDCRGAAVYCNASCCAADASAHALVCARWACYPESDDWARRFDTICYVATGYATTATGTAHDVKLDLARGRYVDRENIKRAPIEVAPALLKEAADAAREYRRSGAFHVRTEADPRPREGGDGAAWFDHAGLVAAPEQVPILVRIFLAIDGRLARQPGGLTPPPASS